MDVTFVFICYKLGLYLYIYMWFLNAHVVWEDYHVKNEKENDGGCVAKFYFQGKNLPGPQ